jgi:hypothetical protein
VLDPAERPWLVPVLVTALVLVSVLYGSILVLSGLRLLVWAMELR